MNRQFALRPFRLLALLSIFLAACAPTRPPTQPPSLTAPPSAAPTVAPTVPLAASPTPAPSATLAVTATATATATPEGPLEVSLEAWCTPPGEAVDVGFAASGVAPTSGVWDMKSIAGIPMLHSDVNACTFLFHLNRRAAGARFQILDAWSKPFAGGELTPLEGDANSGYVTVSQGLVNLPLWYAVFSAELVSADGEVWWQERLMLVNGEEPQLCYDGQLPDPQKHRCPGWGEAHPWDAWYGWREDGGQYGGE